MASECKGLCSRYKAKRPKGFGRRRYAAGQKFCEKCHIYINWEGFWCPCCSRKLRCNPRNSDAKVASQIEKEKVLII